MKYHLNDWLNSINKTKNNLMDENPNSEREYPPYIINRCLTTPDCIFIVNEMNQNYFLPKKLQYDFYINIVRTGKRYFPWINKNTIKDLDYVKRYYGYSNEKAKQALRILTEDQLIFIRSKFETGGKNERCS